MVSPLTPFQVVEADAHLSPVLGGSQPVTLRSKVWGDSAERGEEPLSAPSTWPTTVLCICRESVPACHPTSWGYRRAKNQLHARTERESSHSWCLG